MPVNNIDELSQELKDQLQEVPQEGKQIFVAAFNAAQSDGFSEQGAYEVAWNSVKNQYEKGSDGKWHARGEVTAQHNKAITQGGN
ncbi:cation transport regulator ChaB [Brasilonema octagenarum UFV-E1]|uniref:Cation transport regulator ChaB n=2 Tax=Brasilonema TaxID=383614 RepID=A0A856M839_9CYAN|nr:MULTISPECIES: ChaB family protein [Brasilonema]NMF62130.1 cation transport regulator ChaB [Brasilonema octagenarum UFV-OR1]QDL06554.1 cation transport regulator ChaB [Brasilonema sennae CENA114]QDL18412.1 cation transport regulator ChaB [Brasilonema octagenarum UFV-E1]